MKKVLTWKTKKEKENYLKTLKGKVRVEAISYNMSESFQVGDYINHFKFGFGFIQKVINSTKVEVYFEGSEKVLLQNLKKAV